MAESTRTHRDESYTREGYELVRSRETKQRDAILRELDTAIAVVEQHSSSLRTSKKKERYAWILDSVRTAKKQMNEHGAISVSDGTHTQQEGLPVDGLLEVLQDVQKKLGKQFDVLNELESKNELLDHYRAESIKGNIPAEFNFGKDKRYRSDREAAHAWLEAKQTELEQLSITIDTLYKNSIPYFEAHPDMHGDAQHWRTSLEANYISRDHRSTGATTSDYELAMKAFDTRRELVIPAPVEIPEPSPVPDTADTPVSETIETEEEGKRTESTVEVAALVETPPVPTAEDIRPPDRSVFLVDISQIVKRLAWSQAEEKLNEYLNRWKSERPEPAPQPAERKGLLGKLWRGTKEVAKNVGNTLKDIASNPKEFVASTFVRMSERGYLKKFYQEALSQIQSDQNLLAEIEARIRKSQGMELSNDKVIKNFQILDNIIEQYVEDVAESTEKGELVSDTAVQTEVATILYEYATGMLADRAAVEAAVASRIAPVVRSKELKFSSDDTIDEQASGLMYASNIFDAAQRYRGYIQEKVRELEAEFGPENKEAIEGHIKGILAIDVQLGLKARDIRETKPEVIRTWSDRFIDRVQQVPVLGKVLAGPTVMGAGVAAAAGLAMKSAARMPLRAIMAAPAVGALFGGVIGAMRRGRDLQYDRGMELRRQALGQDAGGSRAREVRQFSYEMLNAQDVAERLQSIANRASGTLSDTDVRFVVDVYARLGVETQHNIDQFTAASQEGADLQTKIASMTELKLQLRAVVAKHTAMTPEALATLIVARQNELLDVVEVQDDEFYRFRKREMLKAGAFGAVVGFTAGALADAAIMGIRGRFDESAIGRLGSWMSGEAAPTPSTTFVDVQIPGTDIEVHLPDSMAFVQQGNDIVLVDSASGTVLIEDINIDANGQISQQTLDLLRERGWAVSEQVDPGLVLPTTLHEIPRVPGYPDVRIELPDGVTMSPGVQGLDIIGADGTVYVSGLQLDAATGQFSQSSIDQLAALGWTSETTIDRTSITISDPNEMLARLRVRYSAVEDPTRRRWHGNMDPRSRQLTSERNPYFFNEDNELGRTRVTGPRSDHYPYAYPATSREVAASQLSAQEGILQTGPVGEGQEISGTIFDGRELQFHVHDRGDEYVLEFAGLRDMIQNGGNNWDGSFDHQFSQIAHLVRSGDMAEVSRHFHLRFYVNNEQFRAGEAFSMPLGPDGAVHVPKGSELEALLIDDGGRLRLTTEVSMYDPDRGIARIFATKREGELDTLVIPDENPHVMLQHEATSTVEYDFVPPPEGNNFFVPLPFVPRKAMERGRFAFQPPPVFPYYYERFDSEGLREEESPIDALVSPTLKENPQARLDPQFEISRYLSQHPEKLAELERFDNEIGEPMHDNCRIAVCIPCAAHMEGKNIYRTLEKYAEQTNDKGEPLDRTSYELIIFLNRPVGSTDDGSTAEVERFQADNPDMPIRIMRQETQWASTTPWGEQVNIGSICRRIYDTAALRSLKRDGDSDVGILMADSDLEGMSPTLLHTYMRELSRDTEQKIDAIGGDVDWGPKLIKNPTLFAVTRFWQGLDKQIYSSPDVMRANTPSWGANFLMRASSYAAIGGRRDTPGSDAELTYRFRRARQPKEGNHTKDTYPLRYMYNQWLDSNPRRLVLAHKQGLPAVELYKARETDEIRDLTLDELIGAEQSIDSFDAAAFEREVNFMVQQSHKMDLRDPGSATGEQERRYREYCRSLVDTTLQHMGVGYTITAEGLLQITDVTQLKKKIEQARKKEAFFESLPNAAQGR